MAIFVRIEIATGMTFAAHAASIGATAAEAEAFESDDPFAHRQVIRDILRNQAINLLHLPHAGHA